MKDAASAPEIADPYATLEQILKVISRSWLSEEWRLDDIRLLAQDAIAMRGKAPSEKRPREAVPREHFKPTLRTRPSAEQGGRMPS
jgi:hypothetical protein